ncbi:MAG: hypothetical protein IJC57_00300 [Clostridia bacterium]|nr:hypothetical protein [Clostridia bacterium]MBQ3092696.1 hypothetical protein [Clostridia bacterium]
MLLQYPRTGSSVKQSFCLRR